MTADQLTGAGEGIRPAEAPGLGATRWGAGSTHSAKAAEAARTFP